MVVRSASLAWVLVILRMLSLLSEMRPGADVGRLETATRLLSTVAERARETREPLTFFRDTIIIMKEN